MENRTSPDSIEKVAENEVFVFGSNESGRHGKGAAKQALTWGAKYGQAAGLQGRTYGIPTKNASVTKPLTLDKIQKYADEFIDFAISRPELTFLVTEIGCGLSNYEPKDIAPLFERAKDVQNIHLPRRFWKKLI